MKLGLDIVQETQFQALAGKRIGLMTNPSAVDSRLVSAYDIFRQADTLHLVALFGAEHGVKAAASDGEHVNSSLDTLTGLPVYSLYGETFRPSAEMLDGIELMVCDIQDIGVRYYTFLWTITHIIEACGAAGIPVMLLDRPNPLGDATRGRGLEPAFASLVGRYDIPIQHGMTMGEMLLYLNDAYNPHRAEINIVTMQAWQRKQFWHETGLAFVPPSPNMPHPVTAYHYAGACLIEGTTLSEGRGTALPFEVIAAPYLEAGKLASHLNSFQLEGVRFRPHSLRPSASKYAGQACEGVQAHITNLQSYNPLATWLTVLREIRHEYPDDFAWLPPHNTIYHFDRLIGTDSVRKAIEAGQTVSEIMADWESYLAAFQAKSSSFLQYD